VILHLRGVFLPDEVERDAWVVDGRLTFTRPSGETETVAGGGWITPGLVDAHCHIGLAPDGHVPELDGQVEQAIINRATGTLLLRDAGSPVDNRGVQDRDDLPRLIRAGRHIARPKRYVRELGIEVEPDQLVAEVERQAAAGDGWVKLVGDWIDRDRGELAPLWPDDVLVAAIGGAHELGVRVAAHVFGEDALPGLIAAGLDSIEHGTGLTADLLDDVARRGIAVVPTLVNMRNLPDIAAGGAEKFPAWAAHLRSLHETTDERIRAVWEAGIPLYTGTDAGGSLPHGLIAEEIKALADLGIPLPEVIAQASWRARDWLGLPGLDEGAPADLVVYDTDPRRDLAAIMAPGRMVLRGAVIA
jgi:imidazolonepropionase-like amidohydrolase